MSQLYTAVCLWKFKQSNALWKHWVFVDVDNVGDVNVSKSFRYWKQNFVFADIFQPVSGVDDIELVNEAVVSF